MMGRSKGIPAAYVECLVAMLPAGPLAPRKGSACYPSLATEELCSSMAARCFCHHNFHQVYGADHHRAGKQAAQCKSGPIPASSRLARSMLLLMAYCSRRSRVVACQAVVVMRTST